MSADPTVDSRTTISFRLFQRFRRRQHDVIQVGQRRLVRRSQPVSAAATTTHWSIPTVPVVGRTHFGPGAADHCSRVVVARRTTFYECILRPRSDAARVACRAAGTILRGGGGRRVAGEDRRALRGDQLRLGWSFRGWSPVVVRAVVWHLLVWPSRRKTSPWLHGVCVTAGCNSSRRWERWGRLSWTSGGEARPSRRSVRRTQPPIPGGRLQTPPSRWRGRRLWRQPHRRRWDVWGSGAGASVRRRGGTSRSDWAGWHLSPVWLGQARRQTPQRARDSRSARSQPVTDVCRRRQRHYRLVTWLAFSSATFTTTLKLLRSPMYTTVFITHRAYFLSYMFHFYDCHFWSIISI